MTTLLESIMQNLVYVHRELIQSESLKMNTRDAIRIHSLNKFLELSYTFKDYSERFNQLAKSCEDNANEIKARIEDIY